MPASCLASVDPRRIRQVLTNLTENALRLHRAGDTVDARRPATLPPATVIEVSDTGTGISEEHQERIFDRFFRADPSRNRATGGSGLGLAIARELVHAHGGEITVRSTLGRVPPSRSSCRQPRRPSPHPSPGRDPMHRRRVLARSVGAASNQRPVEPASPLEPETVTDVDR